jgi:molybdate transport system permease protein
MDWQALLLSLRLAAATTVTLLIVACPLAWWLSQPASGWPARLRSLVESVTSLPLVLPPTVLGFYLLVMLGPSTSLGRWITHLLGHPLAFSFTSLVIGSVLYSLPFAVQPIMAGFTSISQNLLDTSAVLGAGPWQRFWRVAFPLARPSFFRGAILVFTHTIGEFGVVLMIGGNIPGSTRTLSIALYDQVENFDYASANRTSLLLIGLSLLGLLALYGRGRHQRSRFV